MEQQLYTAVSSTSSWLDSVENNVFSGSVLLAENADTQLQKQEVRLSAASQRLNDAHHRSMWLKFWMGSMLL